MKNPTTAAVAVVREERRRREARRLRRPALSLALSRRLRREQSGQSLIVAIIVLFLLLFLGGIFIALIANNLRNTRRGVQVSAADQYATAGIRYLDQQLTTSADGADWRPTPDNSTNTLDPDYFWTKKYDPVTGEGGFTRVNFGGPNGGAGGQGGRALVRVTYRPYRVATDGSGALYDVAWNDANNNGVVDAGETTNVPVSNAAADRTRKYIKLESVGRVGSIDPNDPTTFKNSEGLGLRRELVAYKAIGITDYVRYITNKDRKPDPNALGSDRLVQDRAALQQTTSSPDGEDTNIVGDAVASAPYGGVNVDGDADYEIVNRPIVSSYQGPIRVNGDLALYGLNFFALDSRRADALEVAGQITLGGVPGNLAPAPNGAAAANTTQNNDPTKAFVFDYGINAFNAGRGVTAFAGLDPANTIYAGNVAPSTSLSFNTLEGLVRDNPRGSNITGLEQTTQDIANVNLRAVPRLEPPVIDATIGERGLTRYRLLTRDSAPLAAADTTPNPIGLGRNAGAYGWGQGLYIANGSERDGTAVQGGSPVTSPRAEWLNPNARGWEAGQYYVPQGVTITLTPRYMVIEPTNPALGYLRRPTDGRRVGKARIVRYTYSGSSSSGGGALNAPPQVTLNNPLAGLPDVAKYAGYPAQIVTASNGAQVFESDFVVYAEGNIRVRGVAGGLDPETLNTFIRHLTLVSNGTIYVEGNLLRDNIPANTATLPGTVQNAVAAARGRSSVALLAKDYVVVNTTRFLDPDAVGAPRTAREGGSAGAEDTSSLPQTVVLNPAGGGGRAEAAFSVRLAQGPSNQYNVAGLPVLNAGNLDNDIPYYANPANAGSYIQQIFFRHGRGGATDNAAVNLGTNIDTPAGSFYNFPPAPGQNYFQINNENGPFRDDRFPLNSALSPGTLASLFPNTTGAYPAGSNPVPFLGLSNLITVRADETYGQVPYNLTRIGVAPADVRIEAVMYAQEGSFFIIPGPWFNPDPNDTYERFITKNSGSFLRRGGESDIASTTPNPEPRINPAFPFYKQPQDLRITFYGAIAENRSASVGDQSAWLEKWGWVPRFYGSTGLPRINNGYPQQGAGTEQTAHGPGAPTYGQTGAGIQYVYDARGTAPYGLDGTPLRPNPNLPVDPLPLNPRLPVAPGLLYFGEVPLR
jgi:hypothetical protein